MPVRAVAEAAPASSDSPCPSHQRCSAPPRPPRKASGTELRWSCPRGERKGETPRLLVHNNNNNNNKHTGACRGIYLCCQNNMNVFVFVACDYCYLNACFVYLIRRNTSVDESYEWDSADACVDSEVLEATRFDQSRRGRYDQAGGFQDQRRKGDLSLRLTLHVSL